MLIDQFTRRRHKVMAFLVFGLTTLPAISYAFTADDQRRLCTGDVLRLCASEIPNADRITVCMRKQRASLSEGCRGVFEKRPEQSAAAK
jgi:hypothetical protein